MPPDANPELHDDAAGWALGALDPDDAAAFETHLHGCAECQTTVAEFQSMTRALKIAGPVSRAAARPRGQNAGRGADRCDARQGRRAKPRPPAHGHDGRASQGSPDCRQLCRQAVTEAKAARSQRGTSAARMSRWWHWHWNFPVFSLAAALGAAAAAAVVVLANIGQSVAPALVSGTGPPVTTQLYAAPQAKPFGVPHATAVAIARQAGQSWTFELKVHGLRPLPGYGFYECWWSGPGSTPENPKLVSGGTFVVGKSGSATLTMTTGVDPHQFRRMKITAQQPGSGRLVGTTVLVGSAV